MKQKIIKTGVVVEGVDMRIYRSVADPHHVAGRTSRSMSEAFKDADYACAIEKHKPDYLHAFEWFSQLFMFFFWVGCAMSLPIVLALWLFR
jgi:hypothetical protein